MRGADVVKRLLDLILSALAIAILSPGLILIALAIRLESRGGVLFVQERVGRGGRRFNALKFRSMIPGAERTGLGLNVAEGDARITRVGAFLRQWSLDELPQLFNVLAGQMSLVGPRPALVAHAEKYDQRKKRRLEVKPGITGWAQVNGRNALTWKKRIDLDLWYVDHRSFLLDLSILARTVGVVLSREGLYEPNAGLDDEDNVFEEPDDGP